MRFAKSEWNKIAERTGRLQRAKQIEETVVNLGFDVVNPFLEQALQEQVIEISEATAKTTTQGIEQAIQETRDALAAGASEGESIALLTKRVQAVFDRVPKWKARQIAITESSRALADSKVLTANQTGVIQGYRFVPSADACELCQVYTKNNRPTGVPLVPVTNVQDSQKQIGQFKGRTLAPIHPNCRCINVAILDIDPTPSEGSMARNPQFGKKPRN